MAGVIGTSRQAGRIVIWIKNEQSRLTQWADRPRRSRHRFCWRIKQHGRHRNYVVGRTGKRGGENHAGRAKATRHDRQHRQNSPGGGTLKSTTEQTGSTGNVRRNSIPQSGSDRDLSYQEPEQAQNRQTDLTCSTADWQGQIEQVTAQVLNQHGEQVEARSRQEAMLAKRDRQKNREEKEVETFWARGLDLRGVGRNEWRRARWEWNAIHDFSTLILAVAHSSSLQTHCFQL